MGCVFILRVVEKYKIQLDSALFVGGFLDCLPEEIWPYTKIFPSFQKTDFDSVLMKKLIPVSYVLYSDTDPYVPNRQSIMFAKVTDGSTIPLKSAGHMNMEVGMDEFSLVLDLCLTRLDLSYTQKFKFQKQKFIAFENMQNHSVRGHMMFDTEKSLKAKLFYFQNINQSGYATLYTKFKKIQSAHSSYMEYSRKAVKKMKIFERVIVLDKKTDLTDADIVEQIKADTESGIKIFACLYGDIKKEVPEPDFGIWDNRYICINQLNKKGRKGSVTIVSNNEIELKKVRSWWKIVRANSMPIKSVDRDIKKFLASL